ncbi:MAG: helix-turn-helix transcriptional regulator [Clostridium sp.]|nr:helix-turn-helix transcriptional regulator [Clostridium sp.]
MKINMSLIAKFNGNMNVVGRLLKKYRVKNRLSYEQLASKLELMGITIHKQSLYDIENNKRTVKDYELFGIAYVLGINVNDLLEDIKNEFK